MTLNIKTLLLTLSLLAHSPNDVELLARAIEGEGVHLLDGDRDRAGLLIGHVAMNRADAGWWGTLAETLAKDFHGIDTVIEPSDWALALARDAIARQRDLAHGCYFVLNAQDLDKLGGYESEAVIVVGDGDHRLFYYDRWWWE